MSDYETFIFLDIKSQI